MGVSFVDLDAQHRQIADELDLALGAVLARGDFILGESVELFESEMAAYCEAAFAVGVDSGTSALELSLRALGVGDGDEVITAANSFVASAAAIVHAGARPVLVDVDPLSADIDPAQVEAAITPRTKAIMPVHLYGQAADLDSIQEIARRHGLFVVEDASQAHGARYHGRRVGGLGDIGAFSLYPAKNLGALGDAGVIVTNEAETAHRLKLLRNHGSEEKYRHELLGYNRRLDTLQAGVLSVKLRHLDAWNDSRRHWAGVYDELLDGLGDAVVTLPVAPDTEPVYHLYVVRCEDRDGLASHLADEGIGTLIHYPIPIHLLDAFSQFGWKRGDFPATETLADNILSLPMHPHLDQGDVEEVAKAVRGFCGGS